MISARRALKSLCVTKPDALKQYKLRYLENVPPQQVFMKESMHILHTNRVHVCSTSKLSVTNLWFSPGTTW